MCVATSTGESEVETSNSVELAAEVVAAFISNNPLPKSELPALIQAVHSAVERLGKGSENAQPQVELKAPAVPIRKSITPDFLICLEDGKQFKPLRRHLAGLGLTPEQYREKWKAAAGLSYGRAQLRGPAISDGEKDRTRPEPAESRRYSQEREMRMRRLLRWSLAVGGHQRCYPRSVDRPKR
jgi:predicted transcriptional regulator